MILPRRVSLVLRGRRPLALLLAAFFCSCLALIFNCRGVDEAFRLVSNIFGRFRIPPSYKHFYEFERRLPQHDLSLPFPEGQHGRFVYVSNQHWGLGWNNVFQPLYMMSLVAYLSNRAYVFEPYVWSRGPWLGLAKAGGRLVPPEIPLSALIAGPMAGGAFPSGNRAPRAVSAEFFKQVCPAEQRFNVSIKTINEGLQGKPVREVVAKYVQVLEDIPDGCVELRGGDDHPFDWMHFGDPLMNTIYPLLASSPQFQHFSWSPLVLSALRTNSALLSPLFAPSFLDLPNVVPDLIVLHIRRGDFAEHCHNLMSWEAGFMGWNRVPGLANSFELSPELSSGEKEDVYMKQCFPTVDEIVSRVMEAKHSWESRGAFESDHDHDSAVKRMTLKNVYVATNGRQEWVQELADALRDAGGWDSVVSSRDLRLTNEQVYVSQAVDMAIAQRAAVFVGNGFSSMTANINLIRRIHGLPLSSCWFW